MNKPVYLGLSKIDLSKTVIYKFWYDFVKLKYGENLRLSHMDTESFIVYVKTDDTLDFYIKMLKKILKKDLTFQILN